MDRYDPNEWTTSFVRANADFCIQFLQETNAMVIQLLRKENYAASVAGLDRILNGLITFYNAGAQTDLVRFLICCHSMAESHVIAFGLEGGDLTLRRKNAIGCLEDARDFGDEDDKEMLQPLADALYSNKSLAQIRYEIEPNFPTDTIDVLEKTQKLMH